MDFWTIGERILTISGLIGLVITVFSYFKKNQFFFMLQVFSKTLKPLKISDILSISMDFPFLKKPVGARKHDYLNGF